MKLVWHENPDEAVRHKCIYLEKIKRTEGQSLYWQLMRENLKTDPWFFFRVAMEWNWLDEKLVGHHFTKHVADNWGEDIGILMPRGHGKTLPCEGVMCMQIVNKPDVAILQLSRTDDNANKICSFIGDTLIGNDLLQRCFARKYNKDGCLPSSTAETSTWGKKGLVLPWRTPRNDPTFLSISMGSAIAGKHPDIIWVDDPTEEENNNELGWAKTSKRIAGLWFCVQSGGFFIWTGTRWHDADPLGQAVNGTLTGKQGKFKFVQFSCYENDDPDAEPTYPFKLRGGMTDPSGFTKEMLDLKRIEYGEFFDAQMRNDPSPSERADIKVAHINTYEPHELPKLGPVRLLGMESTGGGMVLLNGFREQCDKLRLNVPIEEVINPRSANVTKRDRIVAALQPLVNNGKLFAQKWMIGEPGETGTLGYELRRIGKASHDDIADALHNAVIHLVNGTIPRDNEPAHLYICCDFAYTEKARSDWTVLLALAVDHRGNYYVVDYVRFQCSSPTGTYENILEFYRKYEEPSSTRTQSNKKYPGVWR